MSDEQFKEELLQDFILETREHLETVEPGLLEIESQGDQLSSDIINEVFRAIHSLKSSAGFFGLEKMKTLAHTMENILMKIRDGELNVNQNRIDKLIKGNDILRQMLEDLHNSENIDIDGILSGLQGSLDESKEQATAAKPEEPSTSFNKIAENKNDNAIKPSETISLEKLKSQGNKFYLIGFNCKETDYGEAKSLNEFKELLASIGTLLGDREVETKNNKRDLGNITDQFLIATVLQKDYLSEGLEIKPARIEEIEFARVESILPNWSNPGNNHNNLDANPAQENGKEQNSLAKPEIKSNTTTETLRVPVNILNTLMDLAGELVLNRNQLKQLLNSFSLQSKTLTRVAQNIDIITSDMQSMIMNARLQPIGVLFGKFPRVIRDLSRKLNKDIELTIDGKDVDMDKSIIETLSDPLSHLIRNAADHGIELPDQRKQNGKSETGHILLNAYHKNGMVYIEIHDDGKGIDTDVLKKKAIEKNLIPREELDAMSHHDLTKLIMAPGFTTKTDISDVSGRGVGMDVVKTNIEKLGGTIEVESTLGKFTVITLKLPLTLAIIPSQIVESSFNCYAIPQINLEELVEVGGNSEKFEVENIDGKEILKLRGELLPLVDLNYLLTNETSDAINAHNQKRNILILKSGANRFGLVVEGLLDSEEIVVKPLSSYIKSCKFYSGATILGDGRVAMILDVGGLAEEARLDFQRIQHPEKRITDNNALTDKSGVQFILFENGDRNRFAIPLALVSRIDKVKRDEIEKIEDRIFIESSNSLRRLIWLNDYIDCPSPDSNGEFVYTIIPKTVSSRTGICATKIIDIVSTENEINNADHKHSAILGSSLIDSLPTLFIDLYSLYEEVSPESALKQRIGICTDLAIMIFEKNHVIRQLLVKYMNEVGISPIIPQPDEKLKSAIQKYKADLVFMAVSRSELDKRLPSLNSDDAAGTDRVKFIALKESEDEFRATDTRLERFEDIIMKFDKYALQDCLQRLASKERIAQ